MAFITAIVSTFVILQGIFIFKNIKTIYPAVKYKRWYKLLIVICHCGPVITFIIVSIVIYFVKILQLNFHKDTPKWIPFVHSCFAVYIWINVAWNYCAAVVTKPGKPPKREELISENGDAPEGLDFCASCDRLRTYGTHHCTKCSNCVRMLCHHSSFVNNCVGLSNFAYYFLFLIYGFVGLLYAFYMTYTPFHGCYVHGHRSVDLSEKYPALTAQLCEDVGELPLLFIPVLVATILIGSLLLLHCVLLGADLSLISFIRHFQQSNAVIPFLNGLFKKCFARQRRVKLNILLKFRKQTWKHYLFPTFNILADDLSLDDLIDDDQCVVQMI